MIEVLIILLAVGFGFVLCMMFKPSYYKKIENRENDWMKDAKRYKALFEAENFEASRIRECNSKLSRQVIDLTVELNDLKIKTARPLDAIARDHVTR